MISGNIESVEKGPTVFVNLNPHQAQNQNRARGVMRPDNQVGNERYRKGQNLKVLLVEVQQTPRGPEVVVSRTHRDLLRRLMEAEVPEIGNGTVEIRSIARDPGVRSKVAVASHQEGVDPVGSCIGLRGNRIQSIVNELQGEKIDVIEWDSNPRVLISRALSPADVGAVELDQDENTAYVVVPESQMSLAIGRDGQNAVWPRASPDGGWISRTLNSGKPCAKPGPLKPPVSPQNAPLWPPPLPPLNGPPPPWKKP